MLPSVSLKLVPCLRPRKEKGREPWLYLLLGGALNLQRIKGKISEEDFLFPIFRRETVTLLCNISVLEALRPRGVNALQSLLPQALSLSSCRQIDLGFKVANLHILSFPEPSLWKVGSRQC